MRRKLCSYLMIGALLLSNTLTTTFADTIDASSGSSTGNTDITFEASADMLGGGLIVIIPDEVPLTFDESSNQFVNESSVIAKGYVDVGKHLKVTVPTNLTYTLDMLNTVTADGTVTFGETEDDSQVTEWSREELKTKDDSDTVIGVEKPLNVTVPKNNVLEIGSYSSVINFDINLISDETDPSWFTWSTTSTSATVTGLSDLGAGAKKIVIPSKYNGLPVTTIDSEAFKNETSLTYVAVPSNVKTIDANAFYSCTNLEVVELSEGLETINNSAFFSCSKLASITIPSSVRTIGNNAFDSTKLNGNFEIKEGVTTIGSYAFNGAKFTSVTIPNSVTKIGANAFYNCTSLNTVVMSDNITNIGGKAFYYIKSLSSIKYKGTSYTTLSSIRSALEGNGVTIGSDAFTKAFQ